MSRRLSRLRRAIGSERRFTLLLLFLLFYFFLEPVMAGVDRASAVGALFFTLVLIAAAYSASEKRRVLYAALALLVPTVGVTWFAQFHKSLTPLVAEHILLILFFLYIGGTILRSVMRSERVTLDKVSAALCSYLLLGMAWSFLFSLVELLVPGSFQFAASAWKGGAQDLYDRSGFTNALYFSFTTLTTLGYGDITPHTRLAQNLSAMEAVMGQVYMTVLVARLVGMEISHSSGTRPS
jgi:voltage-gated potassium channel